MFGAAKFRTIKRILAFARGSKPSSHRFTRHDVLFHAKGRNIETVNHVLGRKLHRYVLANRHVHRVELPAPIWMSNVPHPLATDHRELIGIGWSALHLEIDPCTPEKEREKHHGGGRDPGGFHFPRFYG